MKKDYYVTGLSERNKWEEAHLLLFFFFRRSIAFHSFAHFFLPTCVSLFPCSDRKTSSNRGRKEILWKELTKIKGRSPRFLRLHLPILIDPEKCIRLIKKTEIFTKNIEQCTKKILRHIGQKNCVTHHPQSRLRSLD